LGALLQKLIIGGSDYGHHTLTRFFALHAGVLPSLVVAATALHIYLFRRHGITAKQPYRRPDARFWPDQLLKDSVACLAVMAAVLFFVVRPRLFGGDEPLGAELGAPSNPAEPFSAARPEWYFLFLFQMLKYFPGRAEIWGAIVIPTIVLLLVAAMPVLGRWRLGHRFNLDLLAALTGGVALLTWLAVADDRNNPDYQQAVQLAKKDADRVRILAKSPAGIPSSGAVTLLRNDPYTQGPKIFADKCASCHRFDGHNGLGVIPKDPPSAPDLKGFASREWLAGLLDPNQVSAPHYFGGTKFAEGKMARFVKKDVAAFTPEQRTQLIKVLAALSAEAGLKAQRELDQRDVILIEEGRNLTSNEGMRCRECHQFRKPDEDATAPDLTGYGSREWLMAFISDPADARFYGRRNDRMPSFSKDQILDQQAIGLVADWLRGEWYEAEIQEADTAR
jgi:ubiquinol-cytochrome c reductase cytochrome b subunit